MIRAPGHANSYPFVLNGPEGRQLGFVRQSIIRMVARLAGLRVSLGSVAAGLFLALAERIVLNSV